MYAIMERKKMHNSPFGLQASRFMDAMVKVYAVETWKTKDRRYRRMNNRINELGKAKLITTRTPVNMNAEDVRVYLLSKKDEVAATDLVHEVVALRKVLEYCGNNALDKCLAKYPETKPVLENRGPKDPLSNENYLKIVEGSRKADPLNFNLVRGYALVMLSLCGGSRNKEIRFSELKDLDLNTWVLNLLHVKGEKTYGKPRRVFLDSDCRDIVFTYLLARKKYLLDNGVDSNALFPSKNGEFMSSNSIRICKTHVENDLGIKFDLRECRRTYCQRYLDDGLDIESASVLMGHKTTKTTESFYGKKNNDLAIDAAKKVR